MKISAEKNALVYGCYYPDFCRVQQAITEEVRRRSCFWFSWYNCMEMVIDTAWNLGYRYLPRAVENELIRWLMEEFEG